MNWQHYVALGDSLTEGVGDAVEGIIPLSWAARVAEVISPKTFTNLAKRGNTSYDLIATQLDKAVALKPDLVSVLIGGNDAYDPNFQPEVFRANLNYILRTLKRTGATILTNTMADITSLVPPAILPQANGFFTRILTVNGIIRELSLTYSTIFTDLETKPNLGQDPSTLSQDLTHPNMLGYQRIAQYIVEGLLDRGQRYN